MAKVGWRQHVLRCAALLSGVALLVFLIRGNGPSTLVDQIKTLGWGWV